MQNYFCCFLSAVIVKAADRGLKPAVGQTCCSRWALLFRTSSTWWQTAASSCSFTFLLLPCRVTTIPLSQLFRWVLFVLSHKLTFTEQPNVLKEQSVWTSGQDSRCSVSWKTQTFFYTQKMWKVLFRFGAHFVSGDQRGAAVRTNHLHLWTGALNVILRVHKKQNLFP